MAAINSLFGEPIYILCLQKTCCILMGLRDVTVQSTRGETDWRARGLRCRGQVAIDDNGAWTAGREPIALR